MLGIHFYLEYASKAKKRKGTRKNPGEHSGNVVAIFTDTGRISYQYDQYQYMSDALSATFFHADSDVSSGSISREYLSEKCKRISETLAREIHPRLFLRLDD